jgi:hypothetical protein
MYNKLNAQNHILFVIIYFKSNEYNNTYIVVDYPADKFKLILRLGIEQSADNNYPRLYFLSIR